MYARPLSAARCLPCSCRDRVNLHDLPQPYPEQLQHEARPLINGIRQQAVVAVHEQGLGKARPPVRGAKQTGEEQMKTGEKGTDTMMFSDKDLKKLILPLILEQTLAITVGMADTMMISSVGEAAVSGVSLVDMFCIRK